MKGYIYLWENKHNHKKYVGQTIQDPWIRWTAEKNAAYNRKQNTYSLPLSRAIRRYAYKGFTRSIIETIECENKYELIESLNELEEYYIWYYRSFTDWGGGYNATTGGGARVQSEETKQKKSISLRNSKDKFRIKVLCVETNTIYNSISEASEKNSISLSHIAACIKHRKKTIGGYHWCCADTPLTVDQCDELYYANSDKGKPEDCMVPVMIIETKEVFKSMTHAMKVKGTHSSKISACCKHKRKTCGGYHWCYANEPLTIEQSELLYYKSQLLC